MALVQWMCSSIQWNQDPTNASTSSHTLLSQTFHKISRRCFQLWHWAVLSHVDLTGQEHLIAFSSHTLSTSEWNYSQREKEWLSLMFGVWKFHKYVYGKYFTLVTDHHLLTALFGPKSGVPALAAGWLQNWTLFLSSYEYEIEFRTTKAHANVDSLAITSSRNWWVFTESINVQCSPNKYFVCTCHWFVQGNLFRPCFK